MTNGRGGRGMHGARMSHQGAQEDWIDNLSIITTFADAKNGGKSEGGKRSSRERGVLSGGLWVQVRMLP